MIRYNILFIVTLAIPTYSFIPLLMKYGSYPNRVGLLRSNNQDIFDSEEAAAFDAHDAPDAGFEAAAMERSVMMADQIIKQRHTKGKIKEVQKFETELKIPMEDVDDDDIFDAEEAAAYDAHDISDAGIESAAMERAVMMAYRMMANRRKSLKTQLDHVKCAEDEMVLLEKATEDLGKRYRENPAEFKSSFSESDTNRLAIEMIEKAISNAAEEILEAEISYDAIKKNKSRAIEQRNMAEAMAKRFQSELKSNNDSSLMSEDFADEIEVDERRRDQAAVHALQHLVVDTNFMSEVALRSELKSEEDMERIKNKISRLQENQQSLKADLEELVKLVNERLKEEWQSEARGVERP